MADDPQLEAWRRKRIAANVAAFRDINEQLAAGLRQLPDLPELLDHVCECGHADCAVTIRLSREEYEAVRRDSRRFAVAPGHAIPETERVVAANERYEVVEKHGAPAVAIVDATDDRSPGARGRRSEQAVPVARGRVLLCDDALAFSLLFRRWMDGCGVSLVGVTDNARDAVAMAADLRPDVVVLDHLLRDVTSDELVPRLRAAAPGARLLLISGMTDADLAVRARAAGADAHISKVASADAMCQAVLALAQHA